MIREFLDSNYGARLGRRIAGAPDYRDAPLLPLTDCIVDGFVSTELSHYIYEQRSNEQDRLTGPGGREAGWVSGILFSLIASLLSGGILFATACIFGFLAMFLMGCENPVGIIF